MSSIICTVDVALLTLKDNRLHVALLKRDHPPFAGIFSLPGGYIHSQEDGDTRDAAMRTLRVKTGIEGAYLEQLATFSGPGRDPRGWSISVAYYALVPSNLIDQAARPDIVLRLVDQLRGLPFDHQQIIEAALLRVRNKSSYSSLPVHLCGETFTLPQLQKVYETILGEAINKVSFRRKIDELDILEPAEGQMEIGKANRPAQLYRLKKHFRQHLALSDRGLNSIS